VFAEHGIGGMLGLLANGVFAASYIIGLDGVNADPKLYPGGWIKHNYKQLYKQFAYIVAVSVYAFVVSALVAWAINLIPGLHLRASEEAELLGMDDDQLGEFAYDYVEVRRDYLAWTPATADPAICGDIPQGDRHGIPGHSEMLGPNKLEMDEAANDDMGEPTKEMDEVSNSSHTGVGGDRHAIAAKEG
jgi:Amt family ammonium transporter